MWVTFGVEVMYVGRMLWGVTLLWLQLCLPGAFERLHLHTLLSQQCWPGRYMEFSKLLLGSWVA